MIQHKQLAMLAMYFVDQFIFYQINCLLIDIFDLKLSLANFDYRLRIPVPYSEYKGKRIQDKYDYLCLTLNALLRIALCSTRDALPGVVYDEAGQTYTSYRIQARKCSYSEQGIRSRVCNYTELSEARHNYTECPTPNIGTIRSLASYLLRLEQKQICMKKVVERIDIDDIGN